MSENIPSIPGGAVPPKPAESAKVQPKKETVRINLPPKPSAAPTIKLPTLPPGGPSAAPGSAPFPAPATAAPAAPATAAPAAPATSAPRAAAAAAPATSVPAARPTQRPAATVGAPVRAGIGGLDKALAIVAALAALAAVGTTIFCMTLFK